MLLLIDAVPDITADANVLSPADMVPAVLNDPALADPDDVITPHDTVPDVVMFPLVPSSSVTFFVATVNGDVNFSEGT